MVTSGAPLAQASFRDPAGFLVVDGERVLRTVRPEFTADVLAFLRSPLAQKWIQSGRFTPTEVLDAAPGQPLHLVHPRIFFPSYPWEWTPAQLSAAADLTLDLCEQLADAGWILKDATPLNVLFRGPHPVFIDLLSVERRDPENPIWLAYGQFVRTFLLPLAAHKYLGWPLAAALSRRDGYEPSDLHSVLGPFRRWRAPLRSLVTLPVLLERRPASTQSSRIKRSPDVAMGVLKHTLHSLRRSLRRVAPTARESRWSRYSETACHYSENDSADKVSFVRECLSLTQPQDVLDIGANTGFFSRLAAASGARVVAWDTDTVATERSWREAISQQADILPIVADVARPTPAAGWNNAETLSLLHRSRGRFDLVMMLAVLHHLLASDQIPIESVASLAREVTRRWLLIEWVSPADPKFRELSRGRDELYSHLDEDRFLSAFSRYFEAARRVPLANGRILHLLKAR